MGMEVTGKLHAVFEAKQITERFRKREFVVELTDSRYPQLIMFQLTGDRCESIDDLSVGDEVRVEFSLRGREWTSPSGEVKYFNSLDAWTVEPMAQLSGRGPDEPPPPTELPPEFSDDLPF